MSYFKTNIQNFFVLVYFVCHTPQFKRLVFSFRSDSRIVQNFNFTVFEDFCLSLSWKYRFLQNVNHAKVQSKTNKYHKFHVDLTRRRLSKSWSKKLGMVPKKLYRNTLSQRKRRNATSTISSLHDLCKFNMGHWFCDIDCGRRRANVFPIDKLACKWWPHLFFAQVGPLSFVCQSAVQPTHTRGRGDAVAVPLPSVRNWIRMRLSPRCPNYISCLAYRTQPSFHCESQRKKHIKINIFYSVRCKAFYNFLRKPIDDFLRKITKSYSDCNF